MGDWQSVRRHNLGFALLALAAFAVSERSVVLLATVFLTTLASWVITGGWRRRMLPAWAVGLLLFVAFAIGFGRVYPTPDPSDIPSVIGIVVSFVIVIRMYARRSIGDERQILMLSSVLVVAAALQSSDLLVGLLVLGATLMAVNCIVRFRLAANAKDGTPVNVDSGRVFVRESLVQRRGASQDLKRTIRIAFVFVLVMTSAIFLFLPRNPQPTGALFGMAGSGQLEFPNHISLMSPQRLSPSEKELLSVAWLGPDGNPPPNVQVLRLRGAILDRYDVGAAEWFSRRMASERFVIVEGGKYQSLANSPIDERMNTFTMRVEFRGLYSDVVLSPWAPISIAGLTSQVYVFSPATLAVRTLDLESAGVITGYDLRVQPFASESTLESLQGEPVRLPPIATFPVQAVRDAAQRIAAETDLDSTIASQDPAARWARNLRLARIFERELTSERFSYTMDLRSFIRRDGRDPIDLFLNEYRFGHCEYFASGLCALCQSVGVDARIVVGFLVDEYDKSSQRYTVRESDGHAWVEVRTGEYQWTMIDPTPIGNISATPSEDESWAQIFWLLSAPLESLWRDQVAQFDARAQNALAQQANTWIRDVMRSGWTSIEQTARNAGESSRLGAYGIVWIGSVAMTIALSFAAAFIGYRRWRRAQRALGVTRLGRARARVAMRDGAFYVDALDLLDQGGMRRPTNLPLRSFAVRVASEHARAGEIFSEIVERFYAVRFGGQRPDSRRRADDHSLVVQLRQALFATR